MIDPDIAQILLVVGTIFVLIEAFVFTIGVLGVLGVAMTLIGGMALYAPELLPWAVYPIIAVTVALLIWLVVRAMKKPVEAGREAMIGQTATVVEWKNGKGVVMHEGERWNAIGDGGFKKDEVVTITALNKLTLHVEKDQDTKH